MATTDMGLHAVLSEVAREIEIARAPGGGWLGVFTMQPLSISDFVVRELREWGLLEVLEWDDDHPTISRPCRARLSTDGWVLCDR